MGLLDWITESAKSQYAKGAPYREAIGGLLQGDPTKFGFLAKEFNRKAQTPEGALDVALNFAPLGVTKIVSPKTQYEIAQEVAQRNASLPASEGGLGLPPNNTAMDRAKAMGFDTSTRKYHGTNADIKAFDYSKTGQGQDQWGSGFYFTDRPNTASAYVKPLDVSEGGNIYPVYTKTENPLKYDPTSVALQKDISQKPLTKKQVKDLIESSPQLDDALWNWGDWAYEGKNKVLNRAIDAYYDPKRFSLQTLNAINNDFYSGIPEAFGKNVQKAVGKDAIKVGFESGETFDVMLNPANIRSVNAAFDPFRRNEADILAGLLAVPATQLMKPEEKKKNRNAK